MNKKKLIPGVFAVVGLVGMILIGLNINNKDNISDETSNVIEQKNMSDEKISMFEPVMGNLCADVKLYYGSGETDRMFVGDVLGGNENYIDPITRRKYRGVKIRTPSGSFEWKDRNAMVADSRWSIRRDDSALRPCNWQIYSN